LIIRVADYFHIVIVVVALEMYNHGVFGSDGIRNANHFVSGWVKNEYGWTIVALSCKDLFQYRFSIEKLVWLEFLKKSNGAATASKACDK
jgi:hypothetical protein